MIPVQKPKRIAFLTLVFRLGYGVGVVIEVQAKRLRAQGHEVHIFTLFGDRDSIDGDIPVWQLCRKPIGLKTILSWYGFDLVIAHTHPFFRVLPSLKSFAHTIAYEHGCPPPELFNDVEIRKRELMGMVGEVYSQVDAVVSISHFIRKQIEWPQSHIIYNGADHLASRMSGVSATQRGNTCPIRILCVSRFGDPEIKTKGIDLLIQLRNDLPKESFEIHLVGRGSVENMNWIQSLGIRVLMNAPDPVLAQEYMDCDALVSFSRWEGFNLPLVEAGIWGKAALALDIGAHTEVTPFCFSTYDQLLQYLLTSDHEKLKTDGLVTANFVSRFSWDNNVQELNKLIASIDRPLSPPFSPTFIKFARLLLKIHQVAFDAIHVLRKVVHRFRS